MNSPLVMILGIVYAVVVAAIWGLGLLLGWPMGHLTTATVLAVVPCGIVLAVARLLALKKEKAFANRISAQGISSTGAGGSAAEMAEQFRKGLKVIRESHLSRTALTALPWYLVIGAPGSGKSTALRESGLTFPSVGEGLRSFRGIGGTRNCDWWITEEAFFLDTAGRYTTRPDDRSEWLEFLDLIRRFRKGAPLNGIVVTISVPEIIRKDEAALESHAQIVRDRIEEIAERLDVRLPVYLVFTKADLIGGFKNFFADLGGGDKDQAFGACLSWPPAADADYPAQVRAEFEALRPRIATRRLRVLAAGQAEEGAVKALRFPSQLATVQDIMARFVAAVFRPGRIRDAAGLRGFFLTSATQPGAETPAAEAKKESAEVKVSTVAPRPGEELSIFITPGGGGAPAAAAGDKRSGIFLRNLFAKIIIPDRGLVAASLRRQARQRLLGMVARWGAPVLASLLVLAVGSVALGSRSLAADAAATARTLQQQLVEDKPAVERLASLHKLGGSLAELEARTPLGLSGFRDQVADAYYRHLRELVLTPVAGGLHAELTSLCAAEPPDVRRIDELRVAYQVLGGSWGADQNADADLAGRILKEDGRWFAPLVGAEAQRPAAEAALARLVAYPEDSPRWAVSIDSRLVDRMKALLGESTLILAGYREVIDGLRDALPQLDREALVTGPNRELLLAAYAFPGVYCVRGWNDLARARLGDKAAELERKLGDLGKPQSRDAVLRRFADLFRADRDRHWLELVRGATVAPAPGLREAVRRLAIITGPQSPHAELLRAAWRELAVGIVADGGEVLAEEETPAWLKDALDRIDQLGQKVQRFESSGESGRRSEPTDKLLELVAAYEDTRSGLGGSLREIADSRRQGAIRAALEAIAASTWDSLQREVAEEQDREWQEQVAKPWAAEVAGRYPFAAADTELALDRYATLLNPVDGVVSRRLGLVATLAKAKAFDRALLDPERAFLHFGERIALIQAVTFAELGRVVKVPLALTLEQREGVTDMRIVIGEHVFALWDTDHRRTACAWTQGARPGAQIQIAISANASWLTAEGKGAWGLFRLLDQAAITARAAGGWDCTWTLTTPALGSGAQFKASVILEAPLLDERLKRADLFTATVCPARVTP